MLDIVTVSLRLYRNNQGQFTFETNRSLELVRSICESNGRISVDLSFDLVLALADRALYPHQPHHRFDILSDNEAPLWTDHKAGMHTLRGLSGRVAPRVPSGADLGLNKMLNLLRRVLARAWLDRKCENRFDSNVDGVFPLVCIGSGWGIDTRWVRFDERDARVSLARFLIAHPSRCGLAKRTHTSGPSVER